MNAALEYALLFSATWLALGGGAFFVLRWHMRRGERKSRDRTPRGTTP